MPARSQGLTWRSRTRTPPRGIPIESSIFSNGFPKQQARHLAQRAPRPLYEPRRRPSRDDQRRHQPVASGGAPRPAARRQDDRDGRSRILIMTTFEIGAFAVARVGREGGQQTQRLSEVGPRRDRLKG